VIVAGPLAFKWFHGRGAPLMFAREKTGYASAARSQVWGRILLPVTFSRFRLLVAPAARQLPASDVGALSRFATRLVRRSLEAGLRHPASSLLPIDTLEWILSGDAPVYNRLRAAVESIELPSGPTHGDLHRENFLCHDDSLRVIDLDRFRAEGCPLFDLLHFHLSEAQRGSGRRWLDFICERPDIVERSTLGLVEPDALFICYAAQRIAHEGQVASIRGRPGTKFVLQAEHALLRLGEYRAGKAFS